MAGHWLRERSPSLTASSLSEVNPRLIIRRVYRKMFLVLTPLLLFYLISSLFRGGSDFYSVVNGIAPVYLFLALLLPLYNVVVKVPESVWSPAVWLPISLAVFFGFGPLVGVYGNEVTRSYMSSTLLSANEHDIFRANFLSAVGSVLVVFGFWFFGGRGANAPRKVPSIAAETPLINPLKLALIFVFGGGALRYLIIKPAEWGMFVITVPGVISALGALVDVGYGLLSFYMVKSKNSFIRILFWFTWPIHIFFCLLSMSKAELILALLLPALGAFWAHRRRKRFAINVVIMVMIFTVLQPWVYYGRNAIENQSGTINRASYGERIELFANFISGDRHINSIRDERQAWWLRLNFSGKQAYAMRSYDDGDPGNTLKDLWMYFVPRIIWPGKPIMEGPGKQFYSLVTGREGTSFLALSVFGDLYWQFGWLGVLIFCPAIGWFFASLTWRSIDIMRSRQFIMIPLVLIALETALLGMNKFFINGIVATIPVYYSYLALMLLTTGVLNRFRKSSISLSSETVGYR
jgi:hypothetical protein